jgi:hypothetical protein
MSWLSRFLKRKERSVPNNRWIVGLKFRTEDIFNLDGLTIIDCPEGRYIADPFLVEDNNNHWLFYEDYDYQKGSIAVGLLQGLELVDRRTCLETSSHLSFPCVLEFNAQYYMTPEQSASRELWVWVAEDFPHTWKKLCRVANGRYHDPIVRKTAKGSLEIWTTTDDDTVRVFESPKPEGPWILRKIENTKNNFNRSAGNFIGSLRPVQETKPIYGRAIHIVDPNGARIHSIEPDWHPGLNGTHTINFDSRYVVIDGRIPLHQNNIANSTRAGA